MKEKRQWEKEEKKWKEKEINLKSTFMRIGCTFSQMELVVTFEMKENIHSIACYYGGYGFSSSNDHIFAMTI